MLLELAFLLFLCATSRLFLHANNVSSANAMFRQLGSVALHRRVQLELDHGLAAKTGALGGDVQVEDRKARTLEGLGRMGGQEQRSLGQLSLQLCVEQGQLGGCEGGNVGLGRHFWQQWGVCTAVLTPRELLEGRDVCR